MADELTIGAVGDEVAVLHGVLIRAGRMIPAAEITRHFFGPGTGEAVRGWQEQHGLEATGTVDSETAAALTAGDHRVPADGRGRVGARAGRRDPDVAGTVARSGVAAERKQRMVAETRRTFVESLKQQRSVKEQAESKFEQFLARLSHVPSAQLNDVDGRYVPPGASVVEASRTAMRSSIERRLNGAAVAGSIPLSDEHFAQFIGENGNLRENIAAEDFERAVGLVGKPIRVRQTPVGLMCRKDTPNSSCLLHLEDPAAQHEEDTPIPGPQPPDGGANGNGGGAAEKTDIAVLVRNLVEDMTSPESAVSFILNGTSSVEDEVKKRLDPIQEAIQASTLHGGPADSDALFDFHHLRIAFDAVWQELFDKKLVETGKTLYGKFVELGLDPNEYLTDNSLFGGAWSFPDVVKEIAGMAQTAGAGALPGPPASVLAAFDITPDDWKALGAIPDSTDIIPEFVRNKWQPPPTPPTTLAPILESFLSDQNVDPQATTWLDDWWSAHADWSEAQKVLALLAGSLMAPITKDFYDKGNEAWMSYKQESLKQLRRQGQSIVDYVKSQTALETFDQFHELLEELSAAMKRQYRFSIYAANRKERSINFGVVTTYRQRWEPGDYQAGKLVKTIPLAPKEVRRFTKKVSVKQSRAEKEVTSSLSVRKTESSETSRAETEIVEKAHKSTNFKMSAEGGVNIGIVDAKASTSVGHDFGAESQETKKEFHEAVFKAAEEYKAERTLEVNVTDSVETQSEESGEISNPNDEITVTYLFYELQRRFRVSEHLHRLTPVILVAQEFPTPDEIDEAWIVTHDWILRRVILDDSFVPAMNYLSTKVVGDEVALRELYKNLEQHRRLVDDLRIELVAIQAQVGNKYRALEVELERHAQAVQDDEQGGGFTLLPLPIPVIPGDSAATPEAAQARVDAVRDAAERAAKQEKELQARLDRETTALSAITETYTKSLSDHLNRKEQIARLLIHVKANIMYYMQAIWSHEHADQRFFRLHQVPVPRLKGKKTYSVVADPDAVVGPPDWKPPKKVVMKCELDPNSVETETLEEVADIDNLLGFKGNYMMFPLKKTNDLIDFLSLPYVDPFTGLRDPDPLGNWTLNDFAEYVCCLYHKLSKDEFSKLLPGLIQAYQHILTGDGGDEEIIVPTDSLFIEALPGFHPILENFKLMHRAVDVKKVQAEVRGLEFENLRFAARLLEGEREDPTIEKKIVVENAAPVIVDPGP